MPRWMLGLLLVAWMLMASATAHAAAPQLAVNGSRLVDTGTGQTFVPRGVNWPSFEYACTNADYGYSANGEEGQVAPDAAGARVIASWHVNTVRVPLNEECWLGVDGEPKYGTASGYRFAVQQWVTTLHDAGMAVILDLHWSAPAGVDADGQRAMPDDRSGTFWGQVAAAFKDDHAVMFDLFNEPYSFYDGDTLAFDLTWECWRNGGCNPPTANDQQKPNGTTYPAIGMEALVKAVRDAGATQPVLLAGRDYANDLGQWLQSRPPDSQVVASFHTYETQNCHTTQCFDSVIAPIAAQVPVVVTEFGDTDCAETHMNNVMSWADQHGVGYLPWAWWVLNDQPGCQTLALLTDASGKPRAPNGTALKRHLDALAAAGGAGGAGTGGGTSTTPGSTGSGAASTTGSGSGSLGATKTRVSLGGKRTQRLGRSLTVTVTCNVACRARVTGSLATLVRGKRKRFRLRGASGLVAAGRIKELKLGVPKKARSAAAVALRRKRRVTAAITVTAGGLTTKRTITLKP